MRHTSFSPRHQRHARRVLWMAITGALAGAVVASSIPPTYRAQIEIVAPHSIWGFTEWGGPPFGPPLVSPAVGIPQPAEWGILLLLGEAVDDAVGWFGLPQPGLEKKIEKLIP